MSLTTLDDQTALVVIDLQNGVAAIPTQHYPSADVIARILALFTKTR
jgi:nicotinamidase-related amidase